MAHKQAPAVEEAAPPAKAEVEAVVEPAAEEAEPVAIVADTEAAKEAPASKHAVAGVINRSSLFPC